MRKEKVFVVQDAGRDKGKTFQITEMSAWQAEEWGEKALGVAIRGGVDIGDIVAGSGFAGIASVGFMGLFGAPFAEVRPLLDELLACVKYYPDPKKPTILRSLNPNSDDVEEPLTLLRLRMEAFELTSGFSVAAAISELKSRLAAADENSPSTSTSEAG